MQKNKTVTISQETLNKIVNFLATQPYNQVYTLIQELRLDMVKQEKPKTEKE